MSGMRKGAPFSVMHLVIALDTLEGSLAFNDRPDISVFGYTKDARSEVADCIRNILLKINIDPVPIEDVDIIEETKA
jgi:hypothetical protein